MELQRTIPNLHADKYLLNSLSGKIFFLNLSSYRVSKNPFWSCSSDSVCALHKASTAISWEVAY